MGPFFGYFLGVMLSERQGVLGIKTHLEQNIAFIKLFKVTTM